MRDELLKQLTMLDFMATDLALFLDTHPHDKDAIENYNCIVTEACKVRAQYEKMHGPLCSFRSKSPEDVWKWADNPWPWDYDFNFSLSRKEC